MPNHYWSYPGRQVTIQQGVPRGLAGPLAGCGGTPPFSLTPPPEAAQEKGPGTKVMVLSESATFHYSE